MPANLFVLIFPRKVQAHTVFVTRRGKPKSKWGSNPQGGFLNRDSKHAKGDDRNAVRDPMRPGANALNSSASSSGSGAAGGGGSDERSHPDGGASSAKDNELTNQTTVRIQLSRPTEELGPGPANGDSMSWRASSSARPEGKGFHKGIGGGTAGKKAGLGSSAHNRPTDEGLASTISRQRRERRGSFPLPGLRGAALVDASTSGRARSFTVSDGEGGGSSSTGSSMGLPRSRGSSIESGVPSTTGASRHSDVGSTATNQSNPQQQQQPEEGDVSSADSPLPGSAVSGNAGGKNPFAFEALKAGTSPLPQPSAGVVAKGLDRRSESADEIIEGGTGDRREAGIEPVTKADLVNGSEGGEVEECKHPAAGGGRDGAGGRGEKSRSYTLGQATMDTSTSTLGSKRRLVTEVIGDVDVDVSRPQEMDGGEKIDIEAHVKGVLWEMRSDKLLIGEPTFHVSATGKLMTCIFPCDVEDAHLVLTKLESVGVGSECGSVNVLPMEIGRSDITRRRRHEMNGERDEDQARRQRHSRATGGRHGDGSMHAGDVERDEDEARRANVQFRALASQIRVTQVTEEIRQGTKYHFDYMALLVASSAISAMGLATDNVAVVVAAMLVSPIMGPVLAFTFGTNVRDWSLAKKGFLVETLSLSVCVAVGFVVGTVGVFLIAEDTWPTHEMESRGNAWGLLTGIAIAIPSGMAVALSILSKNVNSLVGVAISASLLPPAVNTGMCLSIALVGPAVVSFPIDTMEFLMIGLISMSLTIVNILSIYVAGVWLFIFKEVAPIKSENSFWSRDMIHARKFQQTLTRAGGEGGEAAQNLRQSLLEAANRRRDDIRNGVDPKASSPPAGYRAEPESSCSPPSGTHHRYRSRDHRRRPTVFDLFPDDLDADPGAPGVEHSVAAGKEAGKTERPESLMMGLMAKFLDRKEDNATSTMPIDNEESAESTQRWLKVQNLLGGTNGSNGGGTLRGGGSLRSTRGGGNGGGGGSLRANGGGSLRFSHSRASSKGN